MLSNRVQNMATSATLAMAAKARQLKGEGVDIISLSLGEPDFTVPDFVKDAAVKAIDDDFHTYPPVDGFSELKEAIIHKFERDNGLRYDLSQIVVSTGAKQSLANVALALLNPGDEVILPAPYWVSYREIVKLAGAEPVVVRSGIGTDFKITPEQLEAAITPRTKLLMYSSPCNPTGSVYTEAELRKLADVLQKYPQVVVVSDEIYEYINYTGSHASMAAFPDMYDRTVVVNGLSKAFAMTGWRLGYLAAPEAVARACSKIQGQLTSGANCIAQQAAIAALRAPVSNIQYMIDAFGKRCGLILELLSEIKGIKTNRPRGAFYVFPDVSYYFGKTIRGKTVANATEFCELLLEKSHVATVAGEAFGDANCIRLSYAASEAEIREAIRRIKKVLQG